MQAFIKPFQQLGAYGQIAEKLKKNKGVLWISGCVDSQKVHAACALWQGYRQRLIITYSEQKAKEIYEDCRYFDRQAVLYQAKDFLFFHADMQGNLLVQQRVRALQALLTREEVTVITTFDGLMDRLRPLKKVDDSILCIGQDSIVQIDALAEKLQALLGEHSDLHFFDAAAPLVSAESVDMEHAWMGSRYDKGTDDYVNCPMNQEEYDAFWKELTTAQEAEVHGFEDSQVFEGCMPVEVMARRGHDTLLYGPLKSRGLDDPRTGRWPYAVVQLRRDNAEGTVYNLVGFQTHLKFPEQRRVFSMIPALRNAEFLRYGVMHRNTFLDSPRLLDRYYRLKKEPRIAFAGQMTGVEGYVESAASGFLVGIETARRLKGQSPVDFPREMAIGALALYISNESVTQFQPMNINFGIIPPLDHFVKGKRNKNAEISQRALAILEEKKADILA